MSTHYKSKLNPWPIIAYGLLASLLLPGCYFLMLFATTSYLETVAKGERAAGWLDCGVAIVVGLWGLYFAVRNRKPIRIDERNIFVGKQQIPFSEIESIQVLEREWRGGGWWNTYDEAVVIVLHTKEEIHIKVDNYRNGRVLRAICEKIDANIRQAIFELKSFTPPDVVDIYAIPVNSLQAENFENYKPKIAIFDMLFNFVYPPLFLGLGLILVGGAVSKPANWIVGNLLLAGVGILLLGLGYYATSVIFRQYTYFLLSSQYLVIRYRLPFMKTAVIPLSAIKSIESQSWDSYRGIDRGDAMLIITSDFKLHTFRMPGRCKSLQPLFDKVKSSLPHSVLQE